MNKRILRYLGLLSLILLVLGSCSKEAVEAPVSPQNEIDYRGKNVSLNLSATLSDDQARAAVYNYDNNIALEKGKMPKLSLQSTVPVTVYVRKKGEEAATVSAAILTGKVSDISGEYKIEIKGTIKLRQPDHNLSVGDWEVLCVIGGRTVSALPSDDTEDQPTSFQHIVYPTKEWPARLNAGDQGNVFAWKEGETALTMMPWMTDWNDLKGKANAPETNQPVEGGYGYNTDLHFAPKGILLKVRVRSDVARDVALSLLELRDESSTLFWGGHFDFASKANHSNSKHPVFIKSTGIGVALKLEPKQINAQTGAIEPYNLKAGEEMTESFYVWAMPRGPLATSGQHRIKVTVRGGRSESNEKNLFLGKRYTEIVKMPDFSDFYSFAQNRAPGGKDARSRNNGNFKTQNYFVQTIQIMRINRLGHGFTYEFKPILQPAHPIILTEVLLRPNVPNSNALSNPDAPTYTSAWGGVEIYNASATPVDLSQYAIARITTPDRNMRSARHFVSHPMNLSGGDAGPWTYNMNKALLQRLDFVPNNGSVLVDGTEMPDYTSQYLLIYGTPPQAEGHNKPMLMPGKTAVLLDASYVRYQKNDPSDINVDDIGGIGIQLREAVNKGYAQFVVAIDNAKTKSLQQSWRDSEGPVLYGGVNDSYALFKKNGNNSTYSLVEYLGSRPIDEYITEGSFLLSNQNMMYTTKYARDGNSRTRFTVLLDRINNGDDYPDGGSWASASSLENDATGDFVNHFMTFGSHEWLGPTAKSRVAEWNQVPHFDDEKAKRKWKL